MLPLKKKPEEKLAMEQKWNLIVRSVGFSLVITQDIDLSSKIIESTRNFSFMSKIHLLATTTSVVVFVVVDTRHRPLHLARVLP